jgi:hypothetical protein
MKKCFLESNTQDTSRARVQHVFGMCPVLGQEGLIVGYWLCLCSGN